MHAQIKEFALPLAGNTVKDLPTLAANGIRYVSAGTSDSRLRLPSVIGATVIQMPPGKK